MIKFKKVLSMAALSALFVGTLASCGQNNQEVAEQAAKTVIVQENKQIISSGFKVQATANANNKDWDVSWYSSNTALLDFQKVEAEGDNKAYYNAIVTQPASDSKDDWTEVGFWCIVNVNGTEVRNDYKVRIEREKTPIEKAAIWFDGSASNMTIEGYVYKKVGYVDSYKEGNIIVYDTVSKASYFIYNAFIDKEVYTNLQGGEYVKVTGINSSPYNGLLESKYGATITVDTSKEKLDLSTIEETNITSNAIRGNKEELIKSQSKPVKLEQFTVTEVTEKFENKAGKYGTSLQTVATVERCGQKFKVAVMEGLTPFAEATTKTFFENVTKSIKKDDVITVNGLLAWDGDPTIVITSADQVKKEALVKTDYDKAYEGVVWVNEQINYGTVFETVTINKSEAAAVGIGVEVGKITGTVIKYDETAGTLTITPTAEKVNGQFVLTFKVGTETITHRFSVTSQLKTREQLINEAKETLTDYESNGGTINLPKNIKNSTIGLTYALAANENGITLDPATGVLTVPAGDACEVTLTVTLTLGETSDTKEIKVKRTHEVLNVAQTLALSADLSDQKTVFVEGVVSYIDVYVKNNKVQNITFYLGSSVDDGKDYAKTVVLFRLTGDFDDVDATGWTDEQKAAFVKERYGIEKGDTATGYGVFEIYTNSKGVKQFELVSNDKVADGKPVAAKNAISKEGKF